MRGERPKRNEQGAEQTNSEKQNKIKRKEMLLLFEFIKSKDHTKQNKNKQCINVSFVFARTSASALLDHVMTGTSPPSERQVAGEALCMDKKELDLNDRVPCKLPQGRQQLQQQQRQ